MKSNRQGVQPVTDQVPHRKEKTYHQSSLVIAVVVVLLAGPYPYFKPWNRCWTRPTRGGRVKTIRSSSKGPARWAHGAGNCSWSWRKAVRIPIFGPAARRIRPNTLTLIAIYLLNGSSAFWMDSHHHSSVIRPSTRRTGGEKSTVCWATVTHSSATGRAGGLFRENSNANDIQPQTRSAFIPGPYQPAIQAAGCHKTRFKLQVNSPSRYMTGRTQPKVALYIIDKEIECRSHINPVTSRPSGPCRIRPLCSASTFSKSFSNFFFLFSFQIKYITKYNSRYR